MQYIVTYNGVTLKTTLVDYSEDPQYSEDGIDLLWKKITIGVRAVVNKDITGMTNAAYLVMLRQKLNEPRQALSFTIDGNVVLNSTGKDCNNGPFSRGVSVEEIRGNTFRVAWTVETYIRDCDDSPGGGGTSFVVSNRWSQTQEINGEGYSVLTTDGTLIISALSNLNPDTLRGYIFPIISCPNGFERDDQRYTLSSDQLRFDYMVRDVEKYRPVVNGITKWLGTWEEESNLDNGSGAVIMGTLTVAATGDRSKSKDDLFNFCIQVMACRVRQGDIIRAYRFTEGLSENTVALSVGIITTSASDTNNLKVTTRIGTPVNPLDSSSATPTVIGSQGTYLAQLFVNAVEGTCDNKMNDPQTQSSTPRSPTGRDKVVYITNTPQTATGSNYVSSDQLQNAYIFQQLEEEIDEDQHKIQLPVANGSQNAASVFIQTAAPTSQKIIKFKFQRLNKQPVIPIISDASHVLLRMKLRPTEAELLPSGNDRIFTTSGTIIYAMTNTARLIDTGFITPRSPVDSLSINDSSRQVDSGSFTAALAK